jgi:hypothetical protein
MLIKQAKGLNEGDTVYTSEGFKPITFLAGPFQNLNQAVWFITGRNEDGEVQLFNLNHIVLNRKMPIVGELWRTAYGATAHIRDLTGNFVIFAETIFDDNDSCNVMTVNDFLKEYS